MEISRIEIKDKKHNYKSVYRIEARTMQNKDYCLEIKINTFSFKRQITTINKFNEYNGLKRSKSKMNKRTKNREIYYFDT